MAVSLFQRLENDVTGLHYRNADEFEAAVLESVLEDLRILLNSSAGCCETCPDYGLSDFNSVSTSHKDTASEICRDIERQIRSFEPRLRNPVVRAVEDADKPLDFLFNVEAELDLGGSSKRIRFDSILDNSGQIRVTA
ncbi:type VI secretion system baseplate subunit TssE [Roseibium marinum]|uniref:Type VI secretion system protein ImpF/type VI secretion system protein n=1 Tax=Roseibium marinum TaxID=281252 RepID=A0A2S3V1G3_9HYPH|nr:type VI secretion system baseplate subunit TssE [Roseibium marinum]POF33796.1 type VI secretion system protein ImpF/type VI secretion system protein [Roseibium marinum]